MLRYTVPESNSLGLMLMGGGELGAAARAIADGSADTIITLENNLYRRADAATVDAMLSTARHLIAVDSLANATTAKAEVVLPAATFAEGDGTFVNDEGRAQRFYQVFIPEGDIQEGWRWLRDIMPTGRRSEVEVWQDLDTITAALAEQLPVFRSVPDIAPPADYRIAGQKIPRQPARYSGRTAMHANINVSEPQTPPDPDSPLAFTMEGYKGQPPPALIPRFWAPGWNSIQALNKYQEEVGGPLRGGSPGIRLIEPAPGNPAHYFGEVPAAFAPRTGEWLLVPVYHIYGSEERSMLTPGVAELAPAPYIGLNAAMAEGLQAQEGDQIELAYNGSAYRLPVRLMPSLPAGVAGLPAGLPGLEGIVLPGWGSLSLRREQPRT
jgi:NADH-quinone oxidoreductase subunit G